MERESVPRWCGLLWVALFVGAILMRVLTKS